MGTYVLCELEFIHIEICQRKINVLVQLHGVQNVAVAQHGQTHAEAQRHDALAALPVLEALQMDHQHLG